MTLAIFIFTSCHVLILHTITIIVTTTTNNNINFTLEALICQNFAIQFSCLVTISHPHNGPIKYVFFLTTDEEMSQSG